MNVKPIRHLRGGPEPPPPPPPPDPATYTNRVLFKGVMTVIPMGRFSDPESWILILLHPESGTVLV